MKSLMLKKYKSEIFKKGYYNASIIDLMNFEHGNDECAKCKENKTKFIIPPTGEISKICLDCLKTTPLEFTHESEYGIISKQEIPPEILEEIGDIRDYVSEESLNELKLTPNFTSIQGGVWKIHCKDFMDFRGIWEPADFTNYSSKLSGRELFLKITDEDENHLWDECEMEENEVKNTWDDAQYYVFECRHCKILRGHWDCS